MISVVAMTEKVKARLTKDRRTIKSLKAKLEIARLANAKLRKKLQVGLEQNRELERQARKRERELRKRQMALPLAIVARVKRETVSPTSGAADAALALDQVAAEVRAL